MGEKDKAEKIFMGCKEVFAELINVLIYAGRGKVEQGNLLPGTTPWNTALSIKEMINRSLPEELEEYISDNKLHVFDMRYLDKPIKNLFQGDIRIVLDYLTDRESLLKRNQVLKHPEETLRMLYALTEDDRYLENIKLVKGGETKVCDLLDEAENRGIQKGIQQSIRILITTCKELGIDYDRTASKLKEKYALPEEETRKDMKLYW